MGSNDYVVKWAASDDDLGAGVANTSIYVSDNGGDSTVWLSQSTASEGLFRGQQGHKYEFVSIATDAAGNIENQQFKLRDLTSRSIDSNEQVIGTDTGTIINKDLPTNSLFAQIEKLVPGRTSSNPAAFQQTLRPFIASSLVTDLPVSAGGVGALAVLALDDGRVLVSGGTNRSSLYVVDKLGNKQLIAEVGEPIFDLAKDDSGALWATTGGAMLLRLDPTTGRILNRYGDGLGQALAINPVNGKIYVSSGDGVEIFDPVTEKFKHFSNRRVDSLAFAPDGSLWATAWPERGNLLKFSATGIPQVMVTTDQPLDSLAFGKTGSKLENLLFASGNDGKLLAVELNSLKAVKIASGGLRGEHLATTADGKIYLAQGSHLDVINPILPPQVTSVNPPPDGTVNLPNNTISVVFDSDMLADSSANSLTNTNNYNLTSSQYGRVLVKSVKYDPTSHTAILTLNTLLPDHYQLTLAATIQNIDGEVLGDYQTQFTAVNDISTLIDLNFTNSRLDRSTNTISYEVSIRNHTDADLTLPAYLLLEPNRGTTGRPQSSTEKDGNYLIDLSASLTNGLLKAGQTIVGHTITVSNPDQLRVDYGASVYALTLKG